jgi:hypothetical protein
MIYKAVCKIFFTEDRLAPHLGPDRLFADPQFDELPVFLLRLAPLPAKLAQYSVCGEARMGLCSTHRGQVAGPRILLRHPDHPCPHRIQDHIPANLKKMAVLLNQDGFVSSLEQVAGPAMPIVKELSVDCTGIFYAEGTGHNDAIVSRNKAIVKIQDVTLSVRAKKNGEKLSLKLLRRSKKIESLPQPQQKTLLKTIDTLLKGVEK